MVDGNWSCKGMEKCLVSSGLFSVSSGLFLLSKATHLFVAVRLSNYCLIFVLLCNLVATPLKWTWIPFGTFFLSFSSCSSIPLTRKLFSMSFQHFVLPPMCLYFPHWVHLQLHGGFGTPPAAGAGAGSTACSLLDDFCSSECCFHSYLVFCFQLGQNLLHCTIFFVVCSIYSFKKYSLRFAHVWSAMGFCIH